MKKESRIIFYDNQLGIEAYRLTGIVQPFPNHFHDYFVIGIMEGGKRCLSCKNVIYSLEKDNIILFNPNENHSCRQIGNSTLDYRALNIPKEVMLNLTREITGTAYLPGFSQNVVNNDEAACYLRPLHEMIMNGYNDFEKEEFLLLLISLLIQDYGQSFENCIPECSEEIEKVCHFIEQHYAEHICLDQICQYAGLSKSTLLRAFTKSKGITPYRYLETIRIGEAKKLLEKGDSPLNAAMKTGFSDQSHFTNYFNSFIGISPGMYRDIFHNSLNNNVKKENEKTYE